MAAEGREMLLDQRYLRQPALDIYGEQLVHMSSLDVEPRGVEIGDIGDTSDGSIFGMNLAIAALKDPFQYAAVFAETRPEELAAMVFILAKPVDVEDPWELRRGAQSSHLEPVREVVAHVIAAEGEHGHGIT